MQKLLAASVLVLLLVGCATEKISHRCLNYKISGDNVDWSPTRFYQSESSQNQLYIEIPKTTNYIPNLEVMDTEFDQPYKVNYIFDDLTHRFKVQDNYDEYLLYRETYDGLHKDKVYVTCNRQL